MPCWSRPFIVRRARTGALARAIGTATRGGRWLVPLLLAACVRAPTVGPLTGMPTTRPLPATELPAGYRSLVFRWQYRERVFSARGDGIARVAAPDSLRIDLFLDNGASAGFVILIADSLTIAAHDNARRFVPPAPMLWAALGRVTMAGPDTVVLVDGDTLRAEIGPSPIWRLAFHDGSLVSAQRLNGRRLEDVVERTDSSVVVYRQPGAARTLTLNVVRRSEESAFDASIWRP